MNICLTEIILYENKYTKYEIVYQLYNKCDGSK